MAFGLDFEEIYCTNSKRVDIGVLNTYKISLDLADEKEFQIESPDVMLPVGGFWYIQDTEYGGIVDGFSTDSDEQMVVYNGRSFRGILNSVFVDVPDDEQFLLMQGSIQECISELIEDVHFTDFIICEPADVDESVDDDVLMVEIARGTSLYDAMMKLAKAINFTLLFEFRKDKMLHITPILAQDYVDYMMATNVAGLGFETEVNQAVVNHLITISTEEETNTVRTIHFFADERGVMQPYATVQTPTKDSHYILDKSSQVLFGLEEVAEVNETSSSVVENYELVEEAPSDWSTQFMTYFIKEDEVDGETGETTVDYKECEPLPNYVVQSSKPSNWATAYSNYYTRSYDQSTGEYNYNTVSGETILDMSSVKKQTKKPKDWKTHFSEYYYRLWNGTEYVYESWSGIQKNRYILMSKKKKPFDWNSNFSSYYRKVYKNVEYKRTKSKNGRLGKKKKVVSYVDCLDRKDAFYKACTATDDKKNGRVPSYTKRNHYRKESYEIAPSGKINGVLNIYRINTKEVAPTWNNSETYYYLDPVGRAPAFKKGDVYRKVLDHYADLAEDALAFFEEQKKLNTQTMSLDDFDVNIGDTVGGRDEMTGTTVYGAITNIELTIENGLIDANYMVVTDGISASNVIELVEEDDESE